MKTWIRMRDLTAAWLLSAVTGACDVQAGEVWSGTWSNRFEETTAEWVLELPEGQGEVQGTVSVGQASSSVKARREGVWLEVTWTDAEGRITQARGVIGEGEWRGLTLSGGGGRMVEYGRFALKRTANSISR